MWVLSYLYLTLLSDEQDFSEEAAVARQLATEQLEEDNEEDEQGPVDGKIRKYT